MADQLTQKLLTELDEIGKGGFDPATVTAVLQDKHRSDIDEGLAETGAPQVFSLNFLKLIFLKQN